MTSEDAQSRRGLIARVVRAGSVRTLATFFLGSLAGVAVDLVVFQLFVRAGTLPVLANLISSGLAITITYALVTRYAFGARARISTYLLFFGWYAISIVAFSFVIQFLSTHLALSAFACKLITLPFSFVVNFLASRLIIGRFGRRPAAPARESTSRRSAPRWVVWVPFVVAWLTLLLAASLLYFQVKLQSDSVFLEDLSRDLFTDGGSWANWRLTPAPAYVPDMLLYFFAYFVFPTVKLRMFFVSFVQVVLLAAAVMFVVRQVVGRFRPLPQAAGVLVVAVVTFACVHTGFWLYFYTTDNHFAAVLFPLLAFGLLLRAVRRRSLLALAGIALCGMLGQMSTTVYLIDFAVPALLALVALFLLLVLFRLGSTHVRRALILSAVSIVVGMALGYVVGKVVTPFDQLPGRYGLSTALLTRGVSSFIEVVKYLLGGGGPVILVLTLLTAALGGYVVVVAIRRMRVSRELADGAAVRLLIPRVPFASEAGAMALGLWVVVWALPIDLAGSVVSGGLVDEHGYRYLMFPVLLLVVLGVVRISTHHLETARWGLPVLGGILAVLLVLTAVSIPGKIAHPAADPVSTPAAACITDLQRQGVTFDSGIGDYWYARGVGYQVPGALQIAPVWGDMEPFYWMATNSAYLYPTKYHRYYDFAVVHAGSGGAPWNVNADTLAKELPAPTQVYTCSTDLQIWTWSDGSLDRLLQKDFGTWAHGG